MSDYPWSKEKLAAHLKRLSEYKPKAEQEKQKIPIEEMEKKIALMLEGKEKRDDFYILEYHERLREKRQDNESYKY